MIFKRSTVEEIERDSAKFYRFQRFEGIKEFAEKSMIPAPFVIIEYIIDLSIYFKNLINGDTSERQDSFRNFHFFLEGMFFNCLYLNICLFRN